MNALGDDPMALLMRTLESDFVPHLTALVADTKTVLNSSAKIFLVPLVPSPSGDLAVEQKRKEQKAGQPYPKDLFACVFSKAPQIGNLS